MCTHRADPDGLILILVSFPCPSQSVLEPGQEARPLGGGAGQEVGGLVGAEQGAQLLLLRQEPRLGRGLRRQGPGAGTGTGAGAREGKREGG